MIRTIGRTELRWTWNAPVVALTYGRWRFRAEDDPDRVWFVRCRLGPIKIEAVRYRW